jgi:S-adenosylmethionine decarboxylase proenzyme
MLDGTHLMVDLYGAKDPQARTVTVLEEVARRAGLNVLNKVEHVFPSGGYGRTAMLLLSESHTSLHTWPENQYVAFDLFSCNDLDLPRIHEVVNYIKQATGAGVAKVNIHDRPHALTPGQLGEITSYVKWGAIGLAGLVALVFLYKKLRG